VIAATRTGLPVSTTHALIGGLVGAGLAQSGGQVHVAKLAESFLLPLLVSPLIAATLGLFAYRLFRLRPVEKDCACVVAPALTAQPTGAGAALLSATAPRLLIAKDATCGDLRTPMTRFSIGRILEHAHVLSAASICFARGVNDTPKLTALLVAAHVLDLHLSVSLVGSVMALGGIVFARNVAETMSRRMARMDATQGLAANLITAALVLFASKLGLPVSTTHVAVGSIAGVGAGARTVDWPTVRNILMSWVATLPLAAGIAWGIASST